MKKLTKRQIAELAFYIENNKLKEPVGKQDQYASAFGGINSYNFTSKGVVKVRKLNISRQVTNNFVITFYFLQVILENLIKYLKIKIIKLKS